MQDKFFVVKTEFNKLRVLPPQLNCKKDCSSLLHTSTPMQGLQDFTPIQASELPRALEFPIPADGNYLAKCQLD